MIAKKNPKKTIMDTLNEHPEGLTIQKTSSLTAMSRLTATKYIHELIGEGKIRERKIGVARLLFAKEKFLKTIKEEGVIEKLKEKLA